MASNEDMASNEERRARKIARRSERKIALRREKKQAAAAEKKKIAAQKSKPSVPTPKLDAGSSTTNFPDECLYPLLTPEEMLHTVLDVTFSEAFTYIVRGNYNLPNWSSKPFRRPTTRPVGSENVAGGSTKTGSKAGKAKKESMTHEEWLEEHLKEVEALRVEQSDRWI